MSRIALRLNCWKSFPRRDCAWGPGTPLWAGRRGGGATGKQGAWGSRREGWFFMFFLKKRAFAGNGLPNPASTGIIRGSQFY